MDKKDIDQYNALMNSQNEQSGDIDQIKQEADKASMHYKKKLNKQQMQLKTIIKEDGTFVFTEEPRVFSASNKGKWMIRLNDPQKTKWDVVIIVLAVYNSFQIPFEIAYEPESMKTAKFFVLNTLIDLMFGIDIVVNFRTTYYDPETQDEVLDPWLTAKEYIRTCNLNTPSFTIDFLSTVPFDSIALLFTEGGSPILQLFSLLKLVRITRLSRIIERMNVRQEMKNAMKLFKLIFMIVVYIHVLACLWFVIVSNDMVWSPTVDYVREGGSDLYEAPLIHQYCISIYSAVLLLTGNDIIPRGTLQVAFVAIFITVGAIINANIFGNMALIISDLNKKSAEFQTQIDTANTAMKNMHLPQHLQTEVISYLNYIQQTLDHQNELKEFFDKISPSLKEEVTRFVFKGILV